MKISSKNWKKMRSYSFYCIKKNLLKSYSGIIKIFDLFLISAKTNRKKQNSQKLQTQR